METQLKTCVEINLKTHLQTEDVRSVNVLTWLCVHLETEVFREDIDRYR